MCKKCILIIVTIILMSTGCSLKDKKIKITFDTDSELGSKTIEVKKGTKLNDLNVPKPNRENYQFSCWVYSNEENCFNPYKEINKNIKLVARYKKMPNKNLHENNN